MVNPGRVERNCPELRYYMLNASLRECSGLGKMLSEQVGRRG